MEASPFRLVAGLLCALTAFSCESKKKAPQQEEFSRPVAEQQEPEQTAVPAPWFVGSWRGKSELSEELSVGDQDATERGERPSGQTLGGPVAFELNLTVTEEEVVGTAKLGEYKAVVNGTMLGESLRLNFRGNSLQGMWGGVRVEPGAQAVLSGTVRASTTKTALSQERVRLYSGVLEMKKSEEVK